VLGGRVEQRGLLGVAQRLATGEHGCLSLACQVTRTLAVVERLNQADIAAAWADIGVGLDRKAAGGRYRFEMLVAGINRSVDARAIARQRLRNLLVDRAQGRALRVERWIVAIGLCQRRFQRFRQYRT